MKAAIDIDGLAGDFARGGGGKKDDHVGDVAWFLPAAKRHHLLHFRAGPFVVRLAGIGSLLIVVLWYAFERTNLGAKIRASVDNRRMAQSVGINVDRLFTLTFAVGSGLAALGGARRPTPA